jgi:hypothetical protein
MGTAISFQRATVLHRVCKYNFFASGPVSTGPETLNPEAIQWARAAKPNQLMDRLKRQKEQSNEKVPYERERA